MLIFTKQHASELPTYKGALRELQEQFPGGNRKQKRLARNARRALARKQKAAKLAFRKQLAELEANDLD